MKVFLDGDDLEVSDVCKEFLCTEAEDTMVSKGFIVNLVSFVSVVIMKRLRFVYEQAPFLAVLPYSEPACIALLNRAHA